jgi:hypothetical protein
MYLQNLKNTRTIYNKLFAYQPDMRIIHNKCIQIPQINKKIIPAVCENIHDYLEKLYKDRNEHYYKYKILEDKILFSDNPDKFKQNYNDIIGALNKLQDEIDNVHEYYEQLDEFQETSLVSDIKTTLRQMKKAKQEENLSLYVKTLKTVRKLENKLLEEPDDIEYIILKPCEEVEITKEDKQKVEIRKEPLEKRKKQKISNTNVKIIKENLKDLIKSKFKPQTLEECASQKRSQPYFMKKEDIINKIEENPEIKRILPANYKSLAKEALCKYLYD